MSGTTKLDADKALEKLRGADASRSRMTQFDEKIDVLDKKHNA
jgi:hypothetical protein